MMIKEQAILGSWGNCVGLRITGNLRKIPQFSAGEVVDIEISENGLSILKKKSPSYSEMELLADLTTFNSHADELVTLIPAELEY
jgi:antitoxin MazE